MNTQAFASLKLAPALLDNLDALGYHQMTPIQAKALPHILAGQDIIGEAETGSGKTAAFALGILQRLVVKQFRIQALILCPTRELAEQVTGEFRRLARTTHNIKVLTLCGGMPFGPQVVSLKHGAHIVVGTPGRIEEHLRKDNLCLKALTCLVLDEADRMLDMGFSDSLEAIISHLPQHRQTLLFSATFTDDINQVAAGVCQNPVHVKTARMTTTALIEQQIYRIDDNDRFTALCRLLLHYRPERTVIFCNTKDETNSVAAQLQQAGFSALALHGDFEQKQRNATLVQFANKSISMLVATDVAARGLDIEALSFVVNYQIARDLQVHVHRVGRTGRANSKGMACTLVSDREMNKKERLETYLGYDIPIKALPDASCLADKPMQPAMTTLVLSLGKKQKIRPGDIVGALTVTGELTAADIGKIQVMTFVSYVAVDTAIAKIAIERLQQGKLKGRCCKVRFI